MAKKVNLDGDAMQRLDRVTEKYAGVKAVRPLSPKVFRQDGAYQNVLTKYGTSRDSSEYYTFVTDGLVSDQELSDFYEQNGLFSRIIDAPAEEAVKHGFELKDIENNDITEFINECLDELDWEETAITALKWARLYGGSIAVLLINDGRKLEDPVDWKHVKSIDDIRVFDRSVIAPDYTSMYSYDSQDPFKTRGSRLGYPERFQISSRTGTFTVHEQRCLIFRNGVLPENTPSAQYQFWGIPEYVRINRAIRDVEIAHGMAPKMLDRAVQAIYKMKDLSQILSTEDGESIVLKRLETIDMSKGLVNSMILDAEGEDYDFKSMSFSGVADVINTTCNYLSALTQIPQTVLFGRSPAGMNSTGTSDMEIYYNYVERIQKRMMRSNLRYLISVICQAAKHTGELKGVPRIDIEFSSLWSMTEQERVALDIQKAQLQSARAQTAVTYIQAQVLDPSEVRKTLAKDSEFDVETMLDDYTEEELEENAPQPQGGDPMAAMMGGGGGDPMAAMMGGGGGDPMAAMMGGGAMPGGGEEPQKGGEVPEDAQESAKTPKQGAEAENGAEQAEEPKAENKAPQEVKENSEENSQVNSEEKHEDEDGAIAAYRARREARLKEMSGAPDAAPNASRLPIDMNENLEEEHEDAEGEELEEKIRVGVGVILVQGDKILTATRIDGDAGGYGLVGGPGGHIEDGELPVDAAQREAVEEFGVMPLEMKPLGIEKNEQGEVVSYVFIARKYAGNVRCDDVEMRRPVWRTMEEMFSMEEKLFIPFKEGLKMVLERMYRYDEEKGEMEYTALEDVIDSI